MYRERRRIRETQFDRKEARRWCATSLCHNGKFRLHRYITSLQLYTYIKFESANEDFS